MPTVYPWESREHPWERRASRQRNADDDDALDPNNFIDDPSPEEAADTLVDFLLTLHTAGKMHANVMCIIAHWASIAAGNAAGDLAKLAMAPGKSSGGYQRHVDTFLGRGDTSDLYEIDIPGHDKHAVARSALRMMAANPHERIHDELLESPDLLQQLVQYRDDVRLPQTYYDHPVVKANADTNVPVIPLSLYLDGVRSHRRETVLNFTIQNIISGKRHLLFVLPHRQQCRCGCLGWCSLYAIYHWLVWCLSSLILGRYPSSRHDGKAWTPNDDLARAATAGTQFGFKAIVLQIRGDWAEFTHSMGFVPWNAVDHPCMFCDSSKDLMYSLLRDCNPLECAYGLRTNASYDRDCVLCEVWIELNQARLDLIRPALFL
jgi:hypothetical protein